MFSQYGEIVDLDLVRDHKTGESKGFAFVGFEDQRSTVLTVDNMNGIELMGRKIRVDHARYKGKKLETKEEEEEDYERRQHALPVWMRDHPGDSSDSGDYERKKSKKKKKKHKSSHYSD